MKSRSAALVIAMLGGLLLAACATYEHPGPPTNDGDSDKVFVCHEGTRTLRITDEEARVHLNHGDRLGRC